MTHCSDSCSRRSCRCKSSRRSSRHTNITIINGRRGYGGGCGGYNYGYGGFSGCGYSNYGGYGGGYAGGSYGGYGGYRRYGGGWGCGGMF